jgi:hypothetical protein
MASLQGDVRKSRNADRKDRELENIVALAPEAPVFRKDVGKLGFWKMTMGRSGPEDEAL